MFSIFVTKHSKISCNCNTDQFSSCLHSTM